VGTTKNSETSYDYYVGYSACISGMCAAVTMRRVICNYVGYSACISGMCAVVTMRRVICNYVGYSACISGMCAAVTMRRVICMCGLVLIFYNFILHPLYFTCVKMTAWLTETFCTALFIQVYFFYSCIVDYRLSRD
jgi:hypothetical protein